MKYLMIILWVAGCVKPAETTMCGEFTCGLGAICSPDGSRCVAPETVAACGGLADNDRCTYTGVSDGVCENGICVPGGCGNGLLEVALGEVCDDGNFISGDGCRSDCLSAEMCGDGIQDLAAGELCDCGSGSTSTIAGCGGKPNSDEPNALCRTNCRPARCGDDIEDAPSEACDDGNTVAGDGCRADCVGRWTQMQSNTFARLRGVWAASPTDAWAVGDNKIVRWNGSLWSAQSFADTAPRIFKAVCGLSPTDVFVVADAELWRYQGAGTTGTWTKIVTDTYGWETMWCRGQDLWVGGMRSNGAGAYAYWTGTAITFGSSFDLGAESTFWSSTDGERFATDNSNALHHASANLVYWYGAGAPESPVPPAVSATKVTGTSSTDIFVTAGGTSGTKHFAGTVWTDVPGSKDLDPSAMAVAPGAMPTRLLQVGVTGGVLDCTAANCTPSLTPTEQNLFGVWALDEKRAFIVGDHGTILY